MNSTGFFIILISQVYLISCQERREIWNPDYQSSHRTYVDPNYRHESTCECDNDPEDEYVMVVEYENCPDHDSAGRKATVSKIPLNDLRRSHRRSADNSNSNVNINTNQANRRSLDENTNVNVNTNSNGANDATVLVHDLGHVSVEARRSQNANEARRHSNHHNVQSLKSRRNSRNHALNSAMDNHSRRNAKLQVTGNRRNVRVETKGQNVEILSNSLANNDDEVADNTIDNPIDHTNDVSDVAV